MCKNTSCNNKYAFLEVKNIYINMKRTSTQYEKTVTYNISVSESYGYSIEVRPEVSDVPAEITTKCSTTSFENPTWLMDVDNHNTTPISCNISQTQY